MHSKNSHNNRYNLSILTKAHPPLSGFVFVNQYRNQTIDFSNPEAVFHLNKALLKQHYNIIDWTIPKGYLCPPIPGRADYIHHLADLIPEEGAIKGLDIGVGANCIYPILGTQIYGWQMIGADINEDAVKAAKHNIGLTEGLSKFIDIRLQKINAHIFEDIIKPDEHFSFTMCNPPFYSSQKDAERETLRKVKNLHDSEELKQNFGGQANELWCNGGEALFIKRMIKESVNFKSQVVLFTTLVSRRESLPKLEKQLKKLKANIQIIPMTQGQKQSRILAWSFK